MHRRIALLLCCAAGATAFSAAPAMLRPAAKSRLAARPLQMQVAGKSYADIMGALKTKVTPKWDDGANPIYNAMEELKEEGVLTRWNSATLKSRTVTQQELQRQLKTQKNLNEILGLIGEVQDADLKKLTVIAFGLSAVFGVGGSIIGGETG